MNADIVIKSRAIFTGLEDNPFAGGIAIKGNYIVAVKQGNEIEEYISDKTKVIEYEDSLVMPGFCDAHVHFNQGAICRSRYFLGKLIESKSEEDAVSMVKEFAEKNPDIKIIKGQGWFPANWGDAPLPTKHSLDSIVADRPVFLTSADCHTVWMNSKALELAKVPKDDSTYLSKYIDKDDKGELTGIVREEACLAYPNPIIQYNEPDIEYEVELDLIKALLECGITMVNDVSGITKGMTYDALERIENEGKLNMRVNIADGINMEGDTAHNDMLQERYHSGFLGQTNIKGVVDGVTSTYTGLLLEPYSDKPETSGEPAYTYQELEKAVIETNKKGYGVRLHCIGDRAVRWALDAFEESSKVNNCEGIRNSIEHIESINAADIDRFAGLNVVASMQPAHLPLDANEQRLRLGEERWKTGWVFRSLLDSNAILAFGTDYPIVEFNPCMNIYYAVTRNGYDGIPTGCNYNEQKITMAEALKAYTYGGAYVCGREKELGTLKEGMLADITVLDRNLFEIDVEAIPEVKAVMTMVDGKIVYEAKQHR